jgi:hypothetical protein
MTRTEAIAKLETAVGALTDEQLTTVAEFATDVASLGNFRFTEEEKAGIARSFDDFKHGRTLTLDEAEARTKAFLAAHRPA